MTRNPLKSTVVTRFNTWLFVFLIVSIAITACKDDDEPGSLIRNEENYYVNSWIQDNMEFWYLWNESIPLKQDKNQSPDAFFSSLLTTEDRFSWIQDNYQELLNSLEGINREAGFEYVLYREAPESESVVAQILYVKPNSPAFAAGLKRGDLITRINDVSLNTSNYRDQIRQLKENHSLAYKPIVVGEETFGPEETISLSVVEYSENPNHHHSVIESEGRKIGYYVYTFFAPGDEDAFDLEMDNIFQQFKSAGITDLVLDLRFNSGGSEVSAKNLASLVGAGINSSSVFLKRQYNKKVNDEIINSPNLGVEFLTSLYSDELSNVGSLLTGKRVYVLTSSRTASASELIINSLRPYMEVFLIGEVTYGKNVGSISLYEENDAKNKWGLQPIVVKVANSLGTADYSDGFSPDILNEDNSLNIYPLGDERENLLAEAIAHITGKPSPGGREAVSSKSEGRKILRHSLDDKRRSFRLLMDDTSLPDFTR